MNEIGDKDADGSLEELSRLYRQSTTATGDCPDSGRLADLAAGCAWPWQRRRLSRHLSECRSCAEDYGVLTLASPGLTRTLEAHAAPTSPRWRLAPLRSGLVTAAVAGAMVVAVVALIGDRGQSRPMKDDVIFASEFEPRGGPDPDGDVAFRSDVDAPGQKNRQVLFADDFSG